MKVKLFYDNCEGKKDLVNYMTNQIGQSKISKVCRIVDKESTADIVLDLENLQDKETIAAATKDIINQIWKTYNQKRPKIFLQRGQKKIRK